MTQVGYFEKTAWQRQLTAWVLLALAVVVGTPARAQGLVLEYASTFPMVDMQYGRDIAVDAQGNAYILVYSADGPTTTMVAKVAPDGTLIYSEFVIETATTWATAMTLTGDGALYLTGYTQSGNFPVLNALQSDINGPSDAFLVKLSASDLSPIFATYLGGSRLERGLDVAVTANDTVVVTGATSSVDFPIVNGLQENLTLIHCFCDDVFVAELSPDGDVLLFSTYWGGWADDSGSNVTVDHMGSILVAGQTQSPDFPLAVPWQSTYEGEGDIFAMKIAPDRNSMIFSTYLGGEEVDRVRDVTVDPQGIFTLTGTTESIFFPTTPDAFQQNFAGGISACGSPPFSPLHNCSDMIVAKLDPTGALVYATFFGGQHEDASSAIALNTYGEVFFVGYTSSSDFPGTSGLVTPGAYIALVHLSSSGTELMETTIIDSPVANAGHGIATDAAGNVYLSGGQNVPADLFVAKYADETQRDCLDFVAPEGIGMEDLRFAASYWSTQNGMPEMDLNQDARLDVRDLVLFLAEEGRACP